ncbi:J domain-containing protein [Leptospira sp. 96542]|nr:J domain-containing protein [Leptospira sp. 96542]
MTPTRYPLQWPTDWKRTPDTRREAGRFTTKAYSGHAEPVTVAAAVDRLLAELERMGVRESKVIISTNVEPTLSGRPRSGERKPQDPGAAVYWDDKGNSRCMAIDRYSDVAQNLAALAATIEAMRAIERHGGAAILDRAFTGFTALPAPVVASTKRSWRDVLEYGNGPATEAEITRNYRVLAKDYHPDRPGGSTDKMAELNAARDEAMQEVGNG